MFRIKRTYDPPARGDGRRNRAVAGGNDDVVFLLDVDNTLLDNDRFAADLGAHLEHVFGGAERDRYWAIYAALWDELEYADYLGTLQRFRAGLEDDPRLLAMSAYLLEYPFEERLYPHALEAIAHLRTMGVPAVLTDGDVVFQPRKIQRSGIWAAVEGRVLIYPHKERRLEAVQRRCPASHYVMVGDKPRLLAAMKRSLGEKLTTVFVRQGQHAAESAGRAVDPPPDLSLEHIGDLLDCARGRFLTVKPARIAPYGGDHEQDQATPRPRAEPVARRHHAQGPGRRHPAAIHR